MKTMLDLVITERQQLNETNFLLKLTTKNDVVLPSMQPGQFVQVRVDGSPSTFLRRPISVNFYDSLKNELWLLIQCVGEGTRRLSEYKVGDLINLLLPLGNSFSIPTEKSAQRLLLVGGGVGTAPMLFLGAVLKQNGFEPEFLLGARSYKDLLEIDLFEQYGKVYCTTEDGSFGEKGYVTNHSILNKSSFAMIYTCGPKPMMVAVAKYANTHKIECEVSLENLMACGFGVCLCCVENTVDGNICVCEQGPVMNIKQLKWCD